MKKRLNRNSLNIELRTTLAAHYYSAKEFDKAIYHLIKVYNIYNQIPAAQKNPGF